MSTSRPHHPTRDDLIDYGQGRLNRARASVIEEHVASCDSCCETLRGLPDDTLSARLRRKATASEMAPAAPSASVEGVPAELRDHPRYRVVRVLGAGGMGVVYKAEHRVMERFVALKVINRRLIGSPVALERFHRETKAAARLSHPAIVTAYDADQAGSLQILVMEYVDGISLARHVEKSGPMAVHQACQVARQTALGLQHAHTKGMIHRDVKPQNLMLTREGRVKILDFGLARYAREAESGTLADMVTPRRAGAAPTVDDARLTQDGATLGTPDYMAPEQIGNAASVDIRADIYGLGCTLYFMLVGRPPFAAGSTADKLLAHLEDEPPDVSAVRSDVPMALVGIIRRMMAKDPADRPATPADVAEALVPFVKASVSPSAETRESAPRGAGAGADSFELVVRQDALSSATAQGQRQRRSAMMRYALPAAAVLGGLLIAVAGWVAMSPSGRQRPVRTDQASLAAADMRASAPPAVATPRGPSRAPGDGMSGAGISGPPIAGSHAWDHEPILLVVPHANYWVPDVENVRRAAASLGATVRIASSERTPAMPSTVGPARPALPVDLLLGEALPKDYAAIIFSGAYPSDALDHVHDRDHAEATRNVIDEFLAAGKPVASICMGSRVLADLGFLQGRAAARCPYQPKTAEYEAKARWTDRPVQSDGLLVTGKDQDTAKSLLLELRTKLR
jgi:serine/threonine-protein kinase